jgi:hypothetical protein
MLKLKHKSVIQFLSLNVLLCLLWFKKNPQQALLINSKVPSASPQDDSAFALIILFSYFASLSNEASA